MNQQLEDKKIAAEAALRWVHSGMLLGLGSGSTAQLFIRALGQRVREQSLQIEAIAASLESERIAAESGLRIVPPSRGARPDLAVDGADEIAPDLSLIKGGGGALLREKAIAVASRYFLVIADSSKIVQQLGAFPLPVEVNPFTLPWVLDQLTQLGANPVQRLLPGPEPRPYVTDQGNYIVDCHFGLIAKPDDLASKIEKIPGVAGQGLFLDLVQSAVIAENGRAFVHKAAASRRLAAEFDNLP
jgi:ribose 5-phosphate isomerase A